MEKIVTSKFFSALALAAALTAPIVAGAQNIIVTSAATSGRTQAGSFVNSHLLGEGVSVFNVRYNGQNTITHHQIGTFNCNGFTQLTVYEGVLMTTGNINVAVGPNDQSGASTAEFNQPNASYYTDTVMNSLVSPQSVTTCSTLDFDFVGLSNEISVSFSFGSEEYPEFVGSSYNDVFAFLLTGLDPRTNTVHTWNIAAVPGTASAEYPDGIPVAINTVNHESNTNYYIENTYEEGVQYDGFTREMVAIATIVPCEVYHMHISVCNVSDKILDSGVFLTGNSLRSTIRNLHIARNNDDTVRWPEPHKVPLNLGSRYDHANVNVIFGGTAASGTDFVCLAGDDTLTPANSQFEAFTGDSLVVKAVSLSSEPKDLYLYLQTAYCTDHPELAVYDTVHLVLIGDPRAAAPTADAPRLNVYPNPADEVLNIEAEAIRSVELYSADGRLALSRRFAGVSRATIATKQLPAGAYSLRVATAGGTATSEVVIR